MIHSILLLILAVLAVNACVGGEVRKKPDVFSGGLKRNF